MPAPWQPPDLDEMRLDHFVVNNEKVRSFLRGEGERHGLFFHLQTTRREGWLARVRAAGFNVRTLADRIDALPAVSPDERTGPEGFRSLATARERLANWDRDRLGWSELPVVNEGNIAGVYLRANEPIRRRRGRGAADYFVAVGERSGRIGLRPARETDALLHAYALMLAEHPLTLSAVASSAGYHVPAGNALRPDPHREALTRLAEEGAPVWTFAAAHLSLAGEVFEKLGIQLRS